MNKQREMRGNGAEQGRLLARPTMRTESIAPIIGVQALGIETARDSYRYVPAGYRAEQPAPLVLMLHGAGGHAHHGLAPLLDLADEARLILLAPASRKPTWDVLLGGYGPDVALIDRALTQIFSRYAIDPERCAIGGFSDGASYALSVGITNGDLFSHVIAFSPGFMAPAAQRGTPRIFISHGRQDSVLPIDRCSRRLVPELERAGYDVYYHEFADGHTVPPEIAAEAVEWFTA